MEDNKQSKKSVDNKKINQSKKSSVKNNSNKTNSTKKSTTNKSTSNKKNTTKNTSNKTNTVKKNTVSKTTTKSKQNIDNKTIKNDVVESNKKNEENKIDINAYVNVLFKESEKKKKTLKELIFLILLLVCLLVTGIIVFLNINNKSSNKAQNKNKKNIKQQEKVDKQIEIEDTDKIAILTFHRITSEEVKNEYFKDNEWVQSVDRFEEQMKYLYENGFKTLSMDEFYCWYKKECKFSKKTIVLTFDDGDLSVYYMVVPILKKYNFKGTAFIVGSRTSEELTEEFSDSKRQFITEDIMNKSVQEYPNFEYQSHSYNFHDSSYKTKVYDLSEDELQDDFDKMSKYNFKYMAYPFGNYNDKLLEKIKENNYNLGFTFRDYDYATRESNQYEIPRIKVNGYSSTKLIELIVGGEYVDE